MRLGTTALVASALTGLLYLSAPGASALPAPSRADVATTKAAGIAQEVRHWRGRGYRRWGGYRGYRGYRGYGYGGYGGYGYPYYYRPYYYGGFGYPYYRRRGFGLYLGY